MKRIVHNLQTTVVSIGIIFGTASSCYANVLGDFFSNLRIEDVQGAQNTTSIPEPATMLLLGIGLILLASVSSKGKKKN